MLPDPESLRCFVAGAELRNFRSAAQRVALSPAAFGSRIKQLEEQLGGALFQRSTRSVTLTPAGERLLPHARLLLAELARCATFVTAGARRAPFSLVIGTRFELGMSWLLPSLGALEAARPERELHLYFADTVDLAPKVLRQEIDAMITSARLSLPGLTHAALHEEQYAFIAARELLKKHPLRSADDAAAHVLLDVQLDLPLFRYFVDARPSRESWTFRHVQRLGTIGAIRARALEGRGVGVLPLYFVREDLARGRLRRLFPSVRMTADRFRLSWRTDHPHASELSVLASELSARPLR